MRTFGLAILLSAFLLFQVQPLIAKAILPWYGSSPAVWTTCMLFFQTLLLAGYAYAHAVANYLPRRAQVITHMGLLLLAGLTLPITPRQPLEAAVGNPTWQILAVLAVSVGFPYTLLSATGPLFQSWFSSSFPGRSPYRLYSLSNIGSLAALFSYPLLVEPWVRVGQQGLFWSGGFGLFVLSAVRCAWAQYFATDPVPAAQDSLSEITAGGGGRRAQRRSSGHRPRAVSRQTKLAATASLSSASAGEPPRPSFRSVAFWFGCAMVGAVVLLAITNQMCQDVAVVPFLWILPLSAYLLSFIICFESDRWYRPTLFLLLTIVGSIFVCLFLLELSVPPLGPQIAIYVALSFAACMCCHGELAKRRPAARWLTLFYLVVSLGGAAGGIFVALLAPLIFLHFWELDLALAATCLLTWLTMVRESQKSAVTGGTGGTTGAGSAISSATPAKVAGHPVPIGSGAAKPSASLARGSAWKRSLKRPRTPTPDLAYPPPARQRLAWRSVLVGSLGIGVVVAETFLGWHMVAERRDALRVERNFYGVLSVQLVGGRRMRDAQGNVTSAIDFRDVAFGLYHGRILHGMQYQVPARRAQPNLYYHERSGIGYAITEHPRRAESGRAFRMGIVGLGTGTLAAYARHGDYLRFYEINPAVVELSDLRQANDPPPLFTFLSDARERGATIEIAVGDARTRLQQELRSGTPGQFDVLVVDAFSGDAIPIHLLTRESFAVYRQHLAEDGVLAIHVSNLYLDLPPVVRRLADDQSWPSLCIEAPASKELGSLGSTWVLVTRNQQLVNRSASWPELSPWTAADEGAPLWTDDFSSILQVIRRD